MSTKKKRSGQGSIWEHAHSLKKAEMREAALAKKKRADLTRVAAFTHWAGVRKKNQRRKSR